MSLFNIKPIILDTDTYLLATQTKLILPPLKITSKFNVETVYGYNYHPLILGDNYYLAAKQDVILPPLGFVKLYDAIVFDVQPYTVDIEIIYDEPYLKPLPVFRVSDYYNIHPLTPKYSKHYLVSQYFNVEIPPLEKSAGIPYLDIYITANYSITKHTANTTSLEIIPNKSSYSIDTISLHNIPNINIECSIPHYTRLSKDVFADLFISIKFEDTQITLPIRNDISSNHICGVFYDHIVVKLSSNVFSDDFRYTTDGSLPTITSTLYNKNNFLILTESCVLNILPFRGGLPSGLLYTRKYTEREVPITISHNLPDDFIVYKGFELILTAPEGDVKYNLNTQPTEYSGGNSNYLKFTLRDSIDLYTRVFVNNTWAGPLFNYNITVLPLLEITSSHQNSTYELPISVELQATDINCIIHYTLDGTKPNLNSPVYSDPISINEPTTLVVLGFMGTLPATPVYTYYYNTSHKVTNVSIDSIKLDEPQPLPIVLSNASLDQIDLVEVFDYLYLSNSSIDIISRYFYSSGEYTSQVYVNVSGEFKPITSIFVLKDSEWVSVLDLIVLK